MSKKNSKKRIFNLKTTLRGGPTGGPTGAHPAAQRAHNRPPLGHLHTKFQCCRSNIFRDMSKKMRKKGFLA